MTVDKITSPVTNKELIIKINEVIDALNAIDTDMTDVETALHLINTGTNGGT